MALLGIYLLLSDTMADCQMGDQEKIQNKSKLSTAAATTTAAVAAAVAWKTNDTHLHAGSATSLKNTHVPPFKQNRSPISGHFVPEINQFVGEFEYPETLIHSHY